MAQRPSCTSQQEVLHGPPQAKAAASPQGSQQHAARGQEARLQQVRQRRGRQLKAAFKPEESILQPLRPAAAGAAAGGGTAAAVAGRGILAQEAGPKPADRWWMGVEQGVNITEAVAWLPCAVKWPQRRARKVGQSITARSPKPQQRKPKKTARALHSQRPNRGFEHQPFEFANKLHLPSDGPALQARQQQRQQAGGVLRQGRGHQLVAQRLRKGWAARVQSRGHGMRESAGGWMGQRSGQDVPQEGHWPATQPPAGQKQQRHPLERIQAALARQQWQMHLKHDDVARIKVLGRQPKHCRSRQDVGQGGRMCREGRQQEGRSSGQLARQACVLWLLAPLHDAQSRANVPANELPSAHLDV